MWAHNTIITARVKQTEEANRKCKEAPFVKEDLVYLLTSHLTLPKGCTWKLAPKFIGPFKILEDYKNILFHLDLPSELRQQGVHPTFHANLLWIHIPNDDKWFPGWQMPQMIWIGRTKDLSINKILQHHRKGWDSLFELQYTTGDSIWLLHYEIPSLEALNQYLEAQNIKSVNELPKQVSCVEEPSPFMINMQQNKWCRDTMTFIDQLPQLLMRMDICGQSHIPIIQLEPHSRYKNQGLKSQSTHWQITHRSTRPMLHYTSLHLSQFCAIAQSICDGSFDPLHDSPTTRLCPVLPQEHQQPHSQAPLPVPTHACWWLLTCMEKIPCKVWQHTQMSEFHKHPMIGIPQHNRNRWPLVSSTYPPSFISFHQRIQELWLYFTLSHLLVLLCTWVHRTRVSIFDHIPTVRLGSYFRVTWPRV
jgi:hypothetical protein